MLLIIANKFDMHVEIVINHLYAEKIPFFRWNVEDFPTNHRISLQTNGRDGDIQIELHAEGRTVNLSEVTKVWYRRPGEIIVSPEITDLAAIRLVVAETNFTLRGLWFLLGDRMWISDPFSNQKMGNKLFQFQLAQKVGLLIPPTLVTNDQETAEEFLKSNEEVIVKTISGGLTRTAEKNTPAYTIYTSKIKDKDVSADIQLEDVQFAPTLFQAYIPKKVELRITIIEEDIFTCAIESQKSERTKIDWRRYDFERVPHYPFELPSSVGTKLIQFMKAGNLKFSTFDMILTPQNEYVFLECNPNGQWHWIEELTGLPITERLIRLMRG